ncbi:MAG: glycine zipper 2TM domain-containing protein [Candidatus Andeanibacterium colombiense]|uniref:17 kDa surface antigen n=1 Tax=Candidatus Andeanibacterium colombiense TaxID=3121345 RepID=A0AAJ5X413_9SPHN|nr:MAG: glycine zipper 2TM domain-containing protein [Sphingomonadaceae bacterium]
MKKVLFALAAVSLALPATPVLAEKHGHGRHDRGYSNTYDNYGRYREPRRLHRGDNMWRGKDGRYYCKRDNGTTGLIIGAAGGALVGRAVDTHGERTTGTLLGAAVGALLGRDIDRGNARCR